MTAYTIPADAYAELTAALLAGDTKQALAVLTARVMAPRDPATASLKQLWAIAGLVARSKSDRSVRYTVLKSASLTRKEASKLIDRLMLGDTVNIAGAAYTRGESAVAQATLAGMGARSKPQARNYDESDIPF